jgi:hypothetical protein
LGNEGGKTQSFAALEAYAETVDVIVLWTSQEPAVDDACATAPASPPPLVIPNAPGLIGGVRDLLYSSPRLRLFLHRSSSRMRQAVSAV